MIEAGELESADAPARRYFERAAEAGSGLALAMLGHLYLSGEDVPQDVDKARELFTAAADRGHVGGYLGLAYLYESGTGLTADPVVARQWYQRAAEAGSTEAQLRLAYLMLQGGDLPSHRAASRWLERAAASGNPQALNDYAWLLATSRHSELRDGRRAVALAQRATESRRTPVYLDTLAAAYADAGEFEEALAVQQEAIDLTPADDAKLRTELKEHLAAFEAGEPWRE
jgi:TPR repeat protein